MAKTYPRVAHSRVLASLEVDGMRVIDLGCAGGKWTRLLASRAHHVTGVDHRPEVISDAQETAANHSVGNVDFQVADFRDGNWFADLGRFDLVTAFGVLHRVANPFEFVNLASKLAPRLLLEWRSPIFPGMQRLSLAAHSEDMFIDRASVGQSPLASDVTVYGSYGFWDLSVYAATILAEREGYPESELLGFARYDDADLSTPRQALVKQFRYVAKRMVKERHIDSSLLSPGETWRAYMSFASKKESLLNFQYS